MSNNLLYGVVYLAIILGIITLSYQQGQYDGAKELCPTGDLGYDERQTLNCYPDGYPIENNTPFYDYNFGGFDIDNNKT